jgi:uncharacterized protein DUF1778
MAEVEVPKSAIITIRVGADDKRLLEAAARGRGMTLSGFALKTLMREAEREAPQQRRDLRVPAMFRTACEEARRGGAGGYARAGRTLALHALLREGPVLEELGELTGRGKDQRALQWCERHYPECLALVPRRRRVQFARGLLGARAAQAARRPRRSPRP